MWASQAKLLEQDNVRELTTDKDVKRATLTAKKAERKLLNTEDAKGELLIAMVPGVSCSSPKTLLCHPL